MYTKSKEAYTRQFVKMLFIYFEICVILFGVIVHGVRY